MDSCSLKELSSVLESGGVSDPGKRKKKEKNVFPSVYFISPAINVRENFVNDTRIAASKNQARLVLRKHRLTATRNLATDCTTQRKDSTSVFTWKN